MIRITHDDLVVLQADLMDAYAQLDAHERKLIDADTIVTNLTSAIASIQSFGLSQELREFYNLDPMLESLSHRDPNTLSASYAIEGIGTKVSEALKKFVEYIKEILARIQVFFQRLFNVVDKKGKEVLQCITHLDYNKQVSIMNKDRLGKLGVAGLAINKYLMSHISVSIDSAMYITDAKNHLTKFATNFPGVLNVDSGGLKLENDAIKFEPLTLKEANYDAETIRTIITSYTDRTKTVGPIRVGLLRAVNSISMLNLAGPAAAAGHFNDLRLTIKTDTFAYSLVGKIQSITARNILAFHKCITPVEATVVIDDPNYQLPSAA